MSDYVERDYERTAPVAGPSRLLPGTRIEIVRDVQPPCRFAHVLFDFDGTLSLIREGWPQVMVPMMVEMLQQTGTHESAAELHRLAHDFVMELTGKQTIYQMIRLAEEIHKRGGTPREPVEYKQMYHDRLMERIRSRREALRTGRVPPEDMVVPGAFGLLRRLRERCIALYLASGTDEQYVNEEARLLGLDAYFGDHIYGAIADYRSFSKAKVIERILQTNRVPGERLLGFGDGYVEIQNIKAVGGLAVGVASDEANRSGNPDPWKRERLIGVGADIVIPDFRESDALLNWLWNAGPAAA